MTEAKTQEKTYPAPQGNPETMPFWEAAKEGRFLIKRCKACGEAHYFFPFAPRPHEQRESTMDRAPQRSEERSV